jgi:hypothetical protein
LFKTATIALKLQIDIYTLPKLATIRPIKFFRFDLNMNFRVLFLFLNLRTKTGSKITLVFSYHDFPTKIISSLRPVSSRAFSRAFFVGRKKGRINRAFFHRAQEHRIGNIISISMNITKKIVPA